MSVNQTHVCTKEFAWIRSIPSSAFANWDMLDVYVRQVSLMHCSQFLRKFLKKDYLCGLWSAVCGGGGC